MDIFCLQLRDCLNWEINPDWSCVDGIEQNDRRECRQQLTPCLRFKRKEEQKEGRIQVSLDKCGRKVSMSRGIIPSHRELIFEPKSGLFLNIEDFMTSGGRHCLFLRNNLRSCGELLKIVELEDPASRPVRQPPYPSPRFCPLAATIKLEG